jgi:hypothetical protein
MGRRNRLPIDVYRRQEVTILYIEEVVMRIFNGIQDLVNNVESLPDVGWLFVAKDFDKVSKADIKSKQFMLAEDDDEETAALKSHKTWLEAPTFVDVVLSKKQHKADASVDDITNAAIYYLEKDAFIDDQ